MTMRVNGPGGVVVNFPDGTDAQTIDKVMREAVAKQAAPVRQQHSWSELPGNIIPSAIDTAKGMYEMASNPRRTINNTMDAAMGGVRKLRPQVLQDLIDNYPDAIREDAAEVQRQEEMANAVGQGLYDRYGNLENIKNTMITDPVGWALDIGSVATGGAGLAGRGPLAINRAAKLAEAPNKVLDVSRSSVKKLKSAMDADAVTPQQITDLGPEGMLLDAGPNLAKQGRGVYSHQGEGSQVVNRALQQRAESTTPRALAAADTAMGPRVNAVEHTKRLEQARLSQGSPLYKGAFNNAKNVNVNPVVAAIDEIVQPNVAGRGPDSMSPVGKKLVGYRNRLTMNNGRVTEARSLQAVYQEIGDDIGEAIRKGRKGEASTLIGIKKKLEASIDEATGNGFSKANQQWATDSEIMDAFGFGEDLARNSLTPDEVAARLGKMKPAARAQVLPGLRNWVYEVVGTARNDAAAARALLQRGWTQEKLGMVLGKTRADELARRIGLERTYAATDQFVRRGSNTTPGLMGAADVADPSLLNGTKDAFAYGGVRGAVRKAGLNAVDTVIAKLAGHRGNVMRADLAKMLTATGAQRDEIVRLLSSPEAMQAFRMGSVPAQTAVILLKGLVAERAIEAVNRPVR